MGADPNTYEQVVSRTLRDNLEKIQRTADELHQAVNDMVAACASSRASNALPSMVRAQTSAASLSATLEVLSRFVTGSLQQPVRVPFEPEILRAPSVSAPPLPVPAVEPPLSVLAPEPAPPASVLEAPPVSAFQPPPPVPAFEPPPSAVTPALEQPPAVSEHPMEEVEWTPPASPVPAPSVLEVPPPAEQLPSVPEIQEPVEIAAFSVKSPAGENFSAAAEQPAPAIEPVFLKDPVPLTLREPAQEFELELPAEKEVRPAVAPPTPVEPMEAAPVFNLDLLPPDEQELHRRAFRVAKVSMQDIRMLRPEDVRLGRQNKDLCFRLRDDIEKAHKEYDRRFQSIQSHPVDYFYDWLVEILGGGDPQALGEYPYPSAVLRR
jgi:hypothetical protein